MTPIRTSRDVLLFKESSRRILVVGCDSAGGVGPKRLDVLKVSGRTVGRYIARVALMEVLTVGAKPLCLVDTLSVEPDPTGKEVLRGVKDEAVRAGLDPDLAVTGSSEKNFKVEQTGLGVTAIGFTYIGKLKMGSSKPRDLVAAIGAPVSGAEVLSAEKENLIPSLELAKDLASSSDVHEVIPVGHSGIAYEAQVVAKDSSLHFHPVAQSPLDLEKSAGPSTVLVVTVSEEKLNFLKGLTKIPIDVVGELLER